MTGIAERDQVLFLIISGMAAKLLVVDFQIRHRTACLTAPRVPAQNLLPKVVIGLEIKA